VAINPELDEDKQLALKMTVAGDSRDRAIELARRMEESHRFTQTNIVSEHYMQATTNGDTEQFELAAVYIPDLAAGPAAQKVAEKPAEAKAQAKANAKAITRTPTAKTAAPRGNRH
jgi:hypothetical protein